MWFNSTYNIPANYTPSNASIFNVTWVNGTNTSAINITQSVIELNYDNNPINYTMNLTSGNEYNGTYGFSMILGAGTYQWRFCALDTESNLNCTDINPYTIGPASIPIYLYLDGFESNKTDSSSYNIYNIANFTVFLNLTNQTIYLYSDYPLWNVQTSNNSEIYNFTNLSFNGGPYNLIAYWNGTSNYTSSSESWFFGVKPYCVNNTQNPASGSTYSASSNYNFSITCLGNIKNSSLIWNGIYYATNNASNLFYYNFPSLSARSNNYYWNITDANNNGFISPNYSFIVNQIPTNLILASSDSDWSIASGTTVSFTCTANNSAKIILAMSGFTSVNGTGYVASGDKNPTSNTYVSCSLDSTENNYTALMTDNWLTVTTTTTTTTTSSGSNTPTGSFLITGLTSSLIAMAGQSASTTFTLSDTLSNNIANVSISVSGIDSSWYTLSNTTISILKRNVPQPMTIKFNIPSNAEAKNYDVTISAKGKALGETTSRIATKTMTLTVNSSQPQPIQPLPSETVSPQETAQQNETANITSNQTASGATGLAATFEFFKNNLVIILAIAACLLIFIFRNNLTTALTGTLGKEEAETQKAKTASPIKGIKDKFDYKLVVNLKKESKANNLKETTEVQGTEKVPELVPGKEPKRPAVLEKEIKRDIKELQSILDAENKVKKNKKKFNLGNN
jgi:hypothetical protein